MTTTSSKTLIMVATNTTEKLQKVVFFGKDSGDKNGVPYSDYSDILENDELYIESCKVDCADYFQDKNIHVENNIDDETFVTMYNCYGEFKKVSNVFNVFQDRIYMFIEPNTSCKIYLNVR